MFGRTDIKLVVCLMICPGCVQEGPWSRRAGQQESCSLQGKTRSHPAAAACFWGVLGTWRGLAGTPLEWENFSKLGNLSSFLSSGFGFYVK